MEDIPDGLPLDGLGVISREIVQLLIAQPDGLTVHEIRQALGFGEAQEHLDRRIRDIRKVYHLEACQEARGYVYRLGPIKPRSVTPKMTTTVRSAILYKARGRCQMCGATIERDHIVLQIDHKIPREWGGDDDPENLWAICEQCNHGKKNYFSSFDAEEMKRILILSSVHERIASVLRLRLGQPVGSDLIEFVATATEFQDDWQKRLRELRYPPIGLKITVTKSRRATGRYVSYYTLENWKDLPTDHRKLIREWDRKA